MKINIFRTIRSYGTLAIALLLAVLQFTSIEPVKAQALIENTITLHKGYTMVGVPATTGSFDIRDLFRLNDAYNGTVIYRFDPLTQAYTATIPYVSSLGGWHSPNPKAFILRPGEGIFVKLAGPAPLKITFRETQNTRYTIRAAYAAYGTYGTDLMKGAFPAGTTLQIMAPNIDGYQFKDWIAVDANTWQGMDRIISDTSAQTAIVTTEAVNTNIYASYTSSRLAISSPAVDEVIQHGALYRYAGTCNPGSTVRVFLVPDGTSMSWAFKDLPCSSIGSWEWEKAYTGSIGVAHVILELQNTLVQWQQVRQRITYR